MSDSRCIITHTYNIMCTSVEKLRILSNITFMNVEQGCFLITRARRDWNNIAIMAQVRKINSEGDEKSDLFSLFKIELELFPRNLSRKLQLIKGLCPQHPHPPESQCRTSNSFLMTSAF